MSQRSVVRTVLERAWLPLVAVIAVSTGALCMWKVHQASAPGPVLAVNGPQAPEEFVPKQLTYELFGSLGDGTSGAGSNKSTPSTGLRHPRSSFPSS